MTDRTLANLAALQEAAAKIEEATPAPTPEETAKEDADRRTADQARKRRPSPQEAAKAWKSRNREYRDRRSETIEFPEQALAIWESVRKVDESERRYGKARNVAPKGLTSRPVVMGDSIDRQIHDRVEHSRKTLGQGKDLRAAILRWPLPMTFYAPVPPLCGVEIELLATLDHVEEEPMPAPEAAVRKDADDARLLGGMRRSGDGLHP